MTVCKSYLELLVVCALICYTVNGNFNILPFYFTFYILNLNTFLHAKKISILLITSIESPHWLHTKQFKNRKNVLKFIVRPVVKQCFNRKDADNWYLSHPSKSMQQGKYLQEHDNLLYYPGFNVEATKLLKPKNYTVIPPMMQSTLMLICYSTELIDSAMAEPTSSHFL